MPQRLFFLNHFPEDQKWKLGYMVSEKAFIDQPFFFGPSLEANINKLQPEAGIIKFKRNKTIHFTFSVDQPVYNILVKPNTARMSKQVGFENRNNEISFDYTLDQYAPFLYIFLNNNGAIVYRMEN